MKKNFFKKLVAAVLTTAVAFSSIAFPNMNAVAANSVYLYGFFDWTTGLEMTLTSGTTYEVEVSLSEKGNMCILQTQGDWNTCASISDINGAASFTDGGHDAVWFDASGDNAGTYTITWDSSTTAMTATKTSDTATIYTYEYYVTGADEFEAESWSNTDASTIGSAGKMTSNGDGTWTYVAHTSADFNGSAGYTIKKLGTPNDDSDKTFSDVKWFENCAYSGAGILTITYNVDEWTSEVTFVQDDLITIGAQSQVNGEDSSKYDLGFVTTISDVVINDNKVADIKEMGIIVINSGEADADDMVLGNATTDGNIRKITTDYVTGISVLDSNRTDEGVYAFRSVIKGITDTTKEYTAVPYIVYENETIVYGSMLTRSVADTLDAE